MPKMHGKKVAKEANIYHIYEFPSMATVSALHVVIQLHDESNVLLKVENRIPAHCVYSLRSGLSTYIYRGNHYVALVPKTTANYNPPQREEITKT